MCGAAAKGVYIRSVHSTSGVLTDFYLLKLIVCLRDSDQTQYVFSNYPARNWQYIILDSVSRLQVVFSLGLTIWRPPL